jgi:hypothetical protein
MRSLIRRITVSEVFNLTTENTDELRSMIDPDVEPYGVKIQKIKITYAQPPTDFMRSEESRQLAILQLAEEAEKQILAERRQRDTDALIRQQQAARLQRHQDENEYALQDIEHRRHVVELEAQIEEIRLARLDDRLRAFPEAIRFDVSTARLDVARALAANTRAVLQIGNADDISEVLLVRDLWDEARATSNGQVPVDASTVGAHTQAEPLSDGAHGEATPMLEPMVDAPDDRK